MTYRLFAGMVFATLTWSAQARDAAPVGANFAALDWKGPAVINVEPPLETTLQPTKGQYGTDYAATRLLSEISSQAEGALDARMERELGETAVDKPLKKSPLVSNN